MSDDAYRTIHCEAWSGLGRALGELADDLVSRVLPAHEDVAFEHVVLALWMGTGRVVAYPRRRFGDRIDIAGCQVVCDEVASDVSALDDQLEELSEDAWQARLDTLRGRLAARVRIVMRRRLTVPFRIEDEDGYSL